MRLVEFPPSSVGYPGPIASILRRVIVTPSGCWEFQGSRNPLGYGQVMTRERSAAGNRTPRQTHRLMYEHFVGLVPDGLVLDHFKCQNPPCCNPAHLEPVTRWENTQRAGTAWCALRAAATECINGHPFDDRNTGRTGQGARYCKRCKCESEKRRRARLACPG